MATNIVNTPTEKIIESNWYYSFQHDLKLQNNYNPIFLGSENVLTHCPTLFIFGGLHSHFSGGLLGHIHILQLSKIVSSSRSETEDTEEKLKWEEIIVDKRPSDREFPCLSYDKKNQIVFLFGGNRNGYLNDFWKFDLASREWTEIETTGSIPRPRCGCSGIYAPSTGNFYVFGGYHGGYLNDFYELDLKTNEWKLLNYSHNIPPSTVLTLNTDSSRDYLTIFGGYSTSNYVTDMYQFDFNRRMWEKSASNLILSDGKFHSRCLTLRGKHKGIPHLNNFLILYKTNRTNIYEYDKEEGELIKYKVPEKIESKFENMDAKFMCEINDDTALILTKTELFLIEIRRLKSTKELDYFKNNLKERIQNCRYHLHKLIY